LKLATAEKAPANPAAIPLNEFFIEFAQLAD
jgi:hypothetical protein